MSHTEHTEAPTESGGVGARVRRREDERHLHGKGKFVADYTFPDLQEVAFLRSPVAHARIMRIGKPERFPGQVIVRDDMRGATDIVADSSLPTYKSSSHPPLASGKVRFVGEPVAMCFAKTRAQAEDIAEEIELDLDELPAFANAFTARERTDVRVHDHWTDNLFLDLKADVNFDERAKDAPVVVKQKVDLARQCMVPMEGKAVLAYWDHTHAQLVVITSTQVPHMIRTVLSQCLGIDHAQVRVISPDVGGAFGYKCVLQQEELCIAWLALTYKKPFRFIEDRREHLIAGANSRQHHYELTAYADKNGRLLALDAELLIDGGAYSAWPFTIGLETGQALGNLPGPYDFSGYRCRTQCAATNKPGFLPYRGVARTGVCFAIELTMDAIARAVGREAWEVRHDNLVRGADMPYTNVVKKHYDSGDFQESLRRAVAQLDVPKWRARQQAGEKDGRLVGIGFATFTEQSAHGTAVFASWGLPVVPGYDLATVRITADGGLEVRAGIHSHGQGMETTLAQIANEVLGVPLRKIKVVHGDTALTPYSTGTYASRSIVMAGGAVATTCRELLPRLLQIGAHLLGEEQSAVRFEQGEVIGEKVVVGESLILLIGGMDLSLEGTYGLAPMIAAWLIVPKAEYGAGTLLSPYLALLIMLLVGAFIGLVNGLLIVKGRLNGFIVTLGMTIVLAGLQLGIVSGNSVFNPPAAFTYLGSANVGTVPVSLIVTVAVFVITGLFLRYHRTGRAIYAVGGNLAAARAAGLKVDRIRIGVYVAGSVLAAVGGLMEAGRVSAVTGQQGYQEGIIFTVFAAAVIGGVSLRGGRGNMVGAASGVILLGLVQNIMDLSQVSNYWIEAVTGGVILVALVLARVIGGEATAE